MKRVLLTGMSGTGKSTVINKLGELGYKVLDTDYGGFTVEVDSGAGPERLWRDDRIQGFSDIGVGSGGHQPRSGPVRLPVSDPTRSGPVE
jgi:predicted ATPase